MALITCCASIRGGWRKRRKKTLYKYGFSHGYCIKTSIPGVSPLRWVFRDCITACGFILFKQWSIFTRRHSVSSVNIVCACCNISDRKDTAVSICASSNQVTTHSNTTSRYAGCGSTATARKTPKVPGRIAHSSFSYNRDVVSLLAFLLSIHALLTTTGSNLTAHAAPSPSYLSTTSARSSARYKLVPVSPNTDTIFIYFNPASILNLKVNTRQSVYFNFTLYPRQSRTNTTTTNNNNNNTSRTKKPPNNNTISPSPKQTNANEPQREATGIVNEPQRETTGIVNEPQREETASASTTTSVNFTGSNHNHSASSLSTTTSASSSSPFANSTALPLRSNNSSDADKKDNHTDDAIYWVMIYSDDDSIARPVIISPNGLALAHADAKGSYILMAVWAGRIHNFSVEARHIGRVTMSVALVDVGDKRMPQAVAASQYPVTAVRGERIADLVFNISAATIAIIISFGIGGVTDTDSLKRQLKFPVPLIIGFCCQFIIMPVTAFGLAMLLPLDKEVLFGLLCVACVPGGGISHVAVIIADGDIALSLTMNLINVLAILGTAPLWIFVLGQYFQSDTHAALNPRVVPIYYFEIWFVVVFLAYSAGLTIKHLRPHIADAILMWLIKPFLLLASILYITLGVYINMYVFELVNGYALLSSMLLPLCGCLLGGFLAAICRQKYSFVKTIALEASSLNCLVVMVAVRFSLKQPDADLAAVIPIWVMFTIPGFFVFLAICNKVQRILLHFWKNRNNKDSDVLCSSKAYSISSSVVSPPGTTTLSAPLVTTDGLDDDATISTTSNQKVTVL